MNTILTGNTIEKNASLSAQGERFKAFETSTDQKISTVKMLTPFLQSLYQESPKAFLTFLDVGCARGWQGYKLATRLGNKIIDYHGIDTEARALEEARLLFAASPVPATLIQGNCFLEQDQQKLPPQADIILLSHVGYYAKDIAKFINDYTQRLATNGLAVFIHNTPESDTNQFRKKYGTPLSLDIAQQIESHLEPSNRVKGMTYLSRVYFPEAVNHYWKDLSQVSFERKVVSADPDFLKVKYLLEFISQPLEHLQERGLLDAFLTEVRERLSVQNNCLYVHSRIQATFSATYEASFRNSFEGAMATLSEEAKKLEKHENAVLQLEETI